MRLLYVEFHDGKECGEDIGGLVAGARATWWTVHAEKRRLLKVFDEKGEPALAQALAQPGAEGEDPSLPAARQALLRAYQRQGLEAVLALLRKPPELSGPLFLVSPPER
jgi:hypothetical protein